MNKMQAKKTSRRPAALGAGMALALSASLLSGCFGESAEQQVASAKKLLEKNDAKGAVIQLKNALQQNASQPEARFLLGKALFQSGDVAGALIELDKARQGGFSNDEMSALTAKSRLAKGELDRLLADFSDAKLQDPLLRSEVHVALASAHLAKGNVDAARSAIEAALRDDPGSAPAQLTRVRLLAGTKDMPGALEALQKLLQAQPKNSQAWRTKAELLQASQRDAKEVIEAYQQALAADPKDVASHAGLITVYMQKRETDAAAKQLEALHAVSPNHPMTRYHSAMLALEKRDLKVAEEHATALLKMTPESAQALHLAGMVDFQLGNYQKAATELSMALQARANARGVRMLLAQTHQRAGDSAKALATLEPLLAESPGLPEAYALAAEVHQQAGETAAAQEMYAKLVKLDPQNTPGRIAVAMTQIERGNAQQGLDALRNLAKGEADTRADMALINALLRRREFDKALVAIEQLEHKQPDKPQGATLRGRTEALRGKADKAREAYEQALKISPAYLPAATALAGLDMLDKKPDEAIKRFEGVVKVNPASVDAKLAIIGLRAQKGESRETLTKAVEALVKEFPREPAPLLALGNSQLDSGQAAKAIEIAQQGKASFPGNIAFVDLLARAYAGSNDLNQAVNAYTELTRLQPRAAAPLMYLAEVHVRRKDLPAAIAQLKKALSLSADYLPAKVKLVPLLVETGQAGEARQLAKGLQQQRPNEAMGWLLEGDIEMASKNVAGAAALYKAGLGKQESSELSIKLYRAYRIQGKDKEAAAQEAAWLEKHPKDATFQAAMAEFAMVSGDVPKAIRLYRSVIQLQPNSVLAINNLAFLLNRTGDPEALAMADKAIAMAPEAAPILDTAAGVYSKSGKHDRAIELQRKALAVAPELHVHRLHLAEIYLAAGKKEEARKELTQLSALGQAFAQQADVQRLLTQLGSAKR